MQTEVCQKAWLECLQPFGEEGYGGGAWPPPPDDAFQTEVQHALAASAIHPRLPCSPTEVVRKEGMTKFSPRMPAQAQTPGEGRN